MGGVPFKFIRTLASIPVTFTGNEFLVHMLLYVHVLDYWYYFNCTVDYPVSGQTVAHHCTWFYIEDHFHIFNTTLDAI